MPIIAFLKLHSKYKIFMRDVYSVLLTSARLKSQAINFFIKMNDHLSCSVMIGMSARSSYEVWLQDSVSSRSSFTSTQASYAPEEPSRFKVPRSIASHCNVIFSTTQTSSPCTTLAHLPFGCFIPRQMQVFSLKGWEILVIRYCYENEVMGNDNNARWVTDKWMMNDLRLIRISDVRKQTPDNEDLTMELLFFICNDFTRVVGI